MKLFFITFFSIFIAELGDKTQLATMGFAASNSSAKWIIFAASAIALTLSSFIGVFFGQYISKYFTPTQINTAAALLFIAIGLFMLHGSLTSKVSKKYAAIIKYINVKENTDCMTCEKFQCALKKDATSEIPRKFQRDDTHPAKNCPNCSAEKLNKMIQEE